MRKLHIVCVQYIQFWLNISLAGNQISENFPVGNGKKIKTSHHFEIHQTLTYAKRSKNR